MRHRCRRVNVWAVVIMVASFACSPNNSTNNPSTTGGNPPDNSTIPPVVQEASDTAVLLVRDINGALLTQASFITAVNALSADANGRIRVTGLPVTGSRLGLLTSPGYLPLPVRLSAAAVGGKTRVVVLNKPQIVAALAANAPATVDLHAHAISLSPNSFVTSDGAPFVGQVHIAASSFDPTAEVLAPSSGPSALGIRSDFSTAALPSGALTMVDANGHINAAPPEGYVSLDASDANGNPLQLAIDTPAVVHIALTPFTQRQPNDVLPLMSFDTNQALWVQQGTCTVQPIPTERNMGNRLECVGAVKHFSAVGVSAASVNGGAFCGRYDIKFTDFTPSNVRITAQESCTGVPWSNVPEQALYRDATQCFISTVGNQSRVIVTATYNGNDLTFVSGFNRLGSTAMSAFDLTLFHKGNLDHACFKCPVFESTFNLADGENPQVDADGDTFSPQGIPADCDDTDPLTNPGAVETRCDKVDRNCDGVISYQTVNYANAGSAIEWNTVSCKLACAQKTTEDPGNAVDEDCDGIVSDADNDGYYNVSDPLYTAALASDANAAADCDDQNPTIHPGAQELAGNNADEDCDGYVVDADGDNYLSAAQSTVSTANVYGLYPLADPNLRYRDCDDWNTGINPNATNLAKESVFAAFYDPNTHARAASMCQYIDPNGALNQQGRGLVVDVNCDGLYSDLDGDGYTVAGDKSLGDGNDIDCDDLDPRLTTQIPCTLSAQDTALDGGGCVPKLQGQRDCRTGFVWSAPVNNCIDINECAQGTASCDANSICVNTQGAYICTALVPDTVVLGNMAVSNEAPGTAHVLYRPASGTNDDFSYSVYYVANAFSAPTTDAVQNEGKQVYFLNRATDFYIDSLTVNANYQVAIVLQNNTTGDVGLYGPQTVTIAPAKQTKRSFMLPIPTGNLGGIAGADSLCNANKPSGVGAVKAFLVDGTTRLACVSPNCDGDADEQHIDWVLQPGIQYVRMDGTPVTIGTPRGLAAQTLTNAWSTSTGAWTTGMEPSLTRDYTNCVNWTDGTSANQAHVGNFHDLTYGGLAGSSQAEYYNCDQGSNIMCIEQ